MALLDAWAEIPVSPFNASLAIVINRHFLSRALHAKALRTLPEEDLNNIDE